MASTRLLRFVASAVGLTLALAACGSTGSPAASDSGGSKAGTLKVAALFSGATTDADYNALGLLALKQAEKDQGVKTAF